MSDQKKAVPVDADKVNVHGKLKLGAFTLKPDDGTEDQPVQVRNFL